MAGEDELKPSMLFRSEDMQYVRMTMAREAAHDTVSELARFGKIHLVDMVGEEGMGSEGFIYYKKRVVACGAWARKLAWLRGEMEANGVEAPGLEQDAFEIQHSGDVLLDLQDYLVPIEEELNRNVEFRNGQRRELHALLEEETVLQTLKDQLNEPVDFGREAFGPQSDSHHELKESLLSAQHDSVERGLPSPEARAPSDGRFHNYVCGIMPIAQQPSFERMLFRVSRGNAYGHFTLLPDEVPDPATGQMQQKAVFYVVYIGSSLRNRIAKICEFFHATVYDMPEAPAEAERQVRVLQQMRMEKEEVLAQTQKQIEDLLQQVAREGGRSPIRDWEDAVRVEKVVCDGLKRALMPPGSKMITVEGWVPTDHLDELRLCVRTATRRSGAQPAVLQELDLGEDVPAPTHFRTNKFTSVFQSIINTYGVPRQGEVNPGLFTIITFPFLFGVMYGDLFHGTCLMFFGLFLVVREDMLGKLKRQGRLGELPGMAYAGRYLLLLMGIFAMYCGFIYNDCASIPIDVFGRKFHFLNEVVKNQTDNAYNAAQWSGEVYPAGVDPTWYHAKNELTFMNSLKMKLAVIFGVSQMMLGLFLSLVNHVHFRDTLSIVCEWIPQFLFLSCTFGYMILMIIIKFTIDWMGDTSRQPPNLIQTTIKLFLSPGSVPKEEELYSGQATVQLALVLLAVVSLPWMLLAKPFALRAKHRRERAAAAGGGAHVPLGASAVLPDGGSLNSPHASGRGELMDQPLVGGDDFVSSSSEYAHHGGDDASPSQSHGSLALSRNRALASSSLDDDHHGEFKFSEAFIHQAIHTTEYALGCVSNTASYLRLWALSLAHSELANVFWEKLMMEHGLNAGNGVMAFVGFGAWAGATFAVLLCMDVLECFLHALRLHWVEFCNKFYYADGYGFQAFTAERQDED